MFCFCFLAEAIACCYLAVANYKKKNGAKMGRPGKSKHGPKPAVCPSCLILSHTHLQNSQMIYGEVILFRLLLFWIKPLLVAAWLLRIQKTGAKMGCPGKWKHGPKPAVCPSCLILSHTHLQNSQMIYGEVILFVCCCFGSSHCLLLLGCCEFKKPVPKWVALASGNMDQNLRSAPPV